MKWARNNVFIFIVLASVVLHVVVIGGLPLVDKSAMNTKAKRVKARIITPKPKPIPLPPKELIEKKPTPIEKPKPVETKPKPAAEKKTKKKKAKKKKGRKKRLPPKTITAKKSPTAPTLTTVQPTSTNRVGSVLDLGDLDPDATDEELNRDFDAEAEDADEVAEVAAEPIKKKPRDRKAEYTCGKYKEGAVNLAIGEKVELILNVSVTKDGRVSDIAIAKGFDPILDKKAKQHAMKCKYRPAIKNGERVAARIPMRVEFK